jgi:hypothetical protein
MLEYIDRAERLIKDLEAEKEAIDQFFDLSLHEKVLQHPPKRKVLRQKRP